MTIKFESLPIYGLTLEDLPPQQGSLKWGVWRERLQKAGRVISEAKNHYAIDFGPALTNGKAKEGAIVVAVAPGRVIGWGYDDTRGNYIILEHDEIVESNKPPRTYRTHYYHLATSQTIFTTPIEINGTKYDVNFTVPGQGFVTGTGPKQLYLRENKVSTNFYVVRAGQPLNYVGNTGASTDFHLHFELRTLNPGVSTNKSANSNTLNPSSLYTTRDPEPFLRNLNQPLPVYILPPASSPGKFPTTSAPPITPFISTFESLHPRLQYELTRRKFSDEMINAYTPFVNLTSLMYVEKEDVSVVEPVDKRVSNFYKNSALVGWCPSLGLHNYGSTLRAEQLYDPLKNAVEGQTDIRSIVGVYTRQNGFDTTGNEQTERVLGLLARKSNNLNEPLTIPYPGITNISIERSLAGPMGVRGGLFRANIKIMAYSIGQIDTLLKYFLRPGTPLVLEFGRRSSNEDPTELRIFDWNRPLESPQNGIKNDLEDILTYKHSTRQTRNSNQTGIYQYVYESYGNYDILIGYAVKFNIKQTKDNVFELDLTMHSIQQFEIPTVQSAVSSNCVIATQKCAAVDTKEYFSPSSSWKEKTFAKFMQNYLSDEFWKTHIVPIVDSSTTAQQSSTGEKGYLITWRFFVIKLLNDELLGLLSLFPDDAVDVARAAFINPLTTYSPIVHVNDKLIANEVGYHPYLRSTDPNTMVIVNKVAQAQEENTADYAALSSLFRAENKKDIPLSPIVKGIGGTDFAPTNPTTGLPLSLNERNKSGVSTLLEGVWINTNAIIEAFTKTDTISQALQALLVNINSATGGYWNLQLITSDDSNFPGVHVVDMGLSKTQKFEKRDTSTSAEGKNPLITQLTDTQTDKQTIIRNQFGLGDQPKYIYVFNERSRILEDGQTFGSELLDLSVNLDLPVAIASQVIAGVGGSAEKGTLNATGVDELDRLRIIKRSTTATRCIPSENTEPPCKRSPIETLQQARERILSNYNTTIENCRLSGPVEENRSVKLERELTADEIERRKNLFPLTAYGVDRCEERAASTRDRALERIGQNALRNPDGNIVRLQQALGSLTDFGSALQYTELNPANMLRKLNLDSRDGEDPIQGRPNVRDVPTAHAFNSSNLTKILVDLTLPGISGIQLLQSFLVDRIPSIVSKGFYVVTKINHEISAQNGWTTKIQGRFRYAPDALPPVRTIPPAPEAGGTAGVGTPVAEWPAPPARGQFISQINLVKVIKRFEADNNLTQTGIVGRLLSSNTSKAISQFQRQYSLSPDGNMGRGGETIRKMLELLNQGKNLNVPTQ